MRKLDDCGCFRGGTLGEVRAEFGCGWVKFVNVRQFMYDNGQQIRDERGFLWENGN